MRGLFMIDRSIIEHHIVGIKNPKRFAAWIWMLSEAQWKPKKVWFNNAEINLERGELLVPLKIASAQVNMTIKQFRTFLSVLNRTGMVTKVGTPKGTPIGKGATVVSICNYDIYQDYEKYRAHQMARQMAHQGHTKGTPRAHDLTPELPDETPELPEYNKSASADLLLREPKIDEIKIAFDKYNQAAKQSGWPIAQALTKQRRSSLQKRLAECGGLSGWEAAIDKAQASSHCCGGNDRGWTASLDFMIRQSSFTKLMEGNYDDRNSNRAQKAGNEAGSNRRDAAIDNIARLAGLGQAQGAGGG